MGHRELTILQRNVIERLEKYSYEAGQLANVARRAWYESRPFIGWNDIHLPKKLRADIVRANIEAGRH